MELTPEILNAAMTLGGGGLSAFVTVKVMAAKALDAAAEAQRRADAAHARLDAYSDKVGNLEKQLIHISTLMEVLPQTTAASLFKELLAAGVYKKADE